MIFCGPQKIVYDSSVNVYFHGNSLTFGVGSTTGFRYQDQVANLWPLVGSGVNVGSHGVTGWTWRNMNGLDGGSSTEVDNGFVAGKKNILVAWETTNTITGRTVAQTYADAKQYITARLTAHPWHSVVIITGLPRSGLPWTTQSDVTTGNLNLVAADDLFRNNYRAIGITALVDTRTPKSPFAFTDYLPASFAATRRLWVPAPTNTLNGVDVHLVNIGYGVIAQQVAGTLAQLPA